MNSVKIKAVKPDGELPMGVSKIWGSPDLPKTFDFPTYKDEEGEENSYEFVCQINCTEVAPFDKDGRLPHVGMLYFFARIGYFLGDFLDEPMSEGMWDKTGVRVFYYPKNDYENLLTMVLVNDQDEEVAFPEQKIEFESVDESAEGAQDGHKLLGAPAYLSDEIDFEKYTLLMQLDSCGVDDDVELNFMDCGMLYFLIPVEDFKKPSFKNVRGWMASS